MGCWCGLLKPHLSTYLLACLSAIHNDRLAAQMGSGPLDRTLACPHGLAVFVRPYGQSAGVSPGLVHLESVLKNLGLESAG